MRVILSFADIRTYQVSATPRAFDVYVNNALEIPGLVVATRQGGTSTALQRTVTPVNVVSNILVIQVKSTDETSPDAFVNALSVRQLSESVLPTATATHTAVPTSTATTTRTADYADTRRSGHRHTHTHGDSHSVGTCHCQSNARVYRIAADHLVTRTSRASPVAERPRGVLKRSGRWRQPVKRLIPAHGAAFTAAMPRPASCCRPGELVDALTFRRTTRQAERPRSMPGRTTAGTWRSLDAGDTWQEMNAGLTSLHVAAMSLASDGGASYPVLVTADAGAFYWDGSAWQKPSYDIDASGRSVIADPGTPSVLYAGTSAGLYSSGDGGRSWGRGIFRQSARAPSGRWLWQNQTCTLAQATGCAIARSVSAPGSG